MRFFNWNHTTLSNIPVRIYSSTLTLNGKYVKNDHISNKTVITYTAQLGSFFGESGLQKIPFASLANCKNSCSSDTGNSIRSDAQRFFMTFYYLESFA